MRIIIEGEGESESESGSRSETWLISSLLRGAISFPCLSLPLLLVCVKISSMQAETRLINLRLFYKIFAVQQVRRAGEIQSRPPETPDNL